MGEEMDPREAEVFLGLPKGAFNHIPIYARKPALEANSTFPGASLPTRDREARALRSRP